jgi:enediyne biosynthesis protein E4
LPDIYTSIVKFKDGKVYPCIAKNMGIKNGIPIFREDAMSLNDFPTAEDRRVASKGGTDNFFKKVLKEKKIIYGAPGPTADYDNDGRMDIFIASWWPEAPSMLLHNETSGGNWLQVKVNGTKGVNSMGIGSRINIYEAGKLGDRNAFLGGQEIAEGFGYASGHAAIAHFGLGKVKAVDVEVILPNNKGKEYKRNVKVNQRIII